LFDLPSYIDSLNQIYTEIQSWSIHMANEHKHLNIWWNIRGKVGKRDV
jgi:hypothetical protein